MFALLPLLWACQAAREPAPSPAPQPQAADPQPPPPQPITDLATGPSSLTLARGPLRLPGTCEASGAGWMAEPAGPVLWVVDDDQKDRILRYTADGAALPPLALHEAGGAPVAIEDLEALVPDGDHAWIMGSHSRSKSGKLEGRNRLAKVASDGTVLTMTSAMRPDLALPEALRAAAAGACPDCAFLPEAETGEAKRGGLDLEGLALNGAGGLLLGLRGPRVDGGRALVVNLRGADGPSPIIGAGQALDLGLRGVRDLAWDAEHGLYLVLAGPSGSDGPPPALYTWIPGGAPVLLGELPDLPGEAPEALALGPSPGELWIAWDAGGRIGRALGDYRCEDLAAEGTFSDWAEARVYTLSQAPKPAQEP